MAAEEPQFNAEKFIRLYPGTAASSFFEGALQDARIDYNKAEIQKDNVEFGIWMDYYYFMDKDFGKALRIYSDLVTEFKISDQDLQILQTKQSEADFYKGLFANKMVWIIIFGFIIIMICLIFIENRYLNFEK